MRTKLLVLVFSLVFGMFASFATPAQAAISLAGTACVISPANSGWTVSAALHPGNGYIYAAITTGGQATGKTTIIVLDPNNPNSTGQGASPGECTQIASLDDSSPRNNFKKVSSLQIPAIVKVDPTGNVYVGRVTTTGFRLFIISSSAPTSDPLGTSYVRSIQILGSVSNNNSGGGMDVSSSYLVATHGMDMTAPQHNRYTMIPTSDLLAVPTISSAGSTPIDVSATWNNIRTNLYFHAYTKVASGTDAVTALPDGRFFVAVAYEGRRYGTLAAFITPASSGTGTVRNIFTGANGWTDLCNGTPRGTLGRNCLIPSSSLGKDNNLYVAFRPHMGERAMRYNTSLGRWESLDGQTNYPTVFDKFFSTNRGKQGKQVKMGIGITADATGQVFISSSHWTGRTYGPLNLAHWDSSTWADKTFSASGKSYGKPQLLIAPFTGEPGRLNVFYVRNIQNKGAEKVQVIWITYSGSITP